MKDNFEQIFDCDNTDHLKKVLEALRKKRETYHHGYIGYPWYIDNDDKDLFFANIRATDSLNILINLLHQEADKS